MLVNLRCNKAQVASQMLLWLSKSSDIPKAVASLKISVSWDNLIP